MSFPSCIKIPSSKKNLAPETTNQNVGVTDSIAYEELISIANIVFGHGRWSHSITSQTVDFVEYVMGKYHIGCAAFVRVQLADGTFHEDMGYSNTESAIKGAALHFARASSINLALKKALLCFGGVIEEKINELAGKSDKNKRENHNSQEEKIDEIPPKTHNVVQQNSTRNSKSVGSFASLGEERYAGKKPSGTSIETSSSTKRSKSPKHEEIDDDIPIASDVRVMMAELQESNIMTNKHNNATSKDGSSIATTEEEIRLERKRKQKQKQEEFQKLMKEKLMKNDEKVSPRF